MADQEELVNQFSSISGVSKDRAKFHLESAAWKLDVALANFYENGGEDDPGLGGMERESPEGSAGTPEPSPPAAASQKDSSHSSRFGTLMNFDDDGNGSSDEGQAFYAGGSEHSGQQVLGPRKDKKDAQKIVDEMFKSAKEHGAEIVDTTAPGQPRGPSVFSGTGYRLGQNENDSQVVPSSSHKTAEPKEVVLKMWKSGFSVDNGPLRDYMDPDNKEFLNSIKRGEIPLELIREARQTGGEINLNMENHQNEDYQPPKLELKPFSGAGYKLGSPAPQVIEAQSQLSETKKEKNEVSAMKSLNLQESEPVTSIQIRLADGSRLLGRFNHTHTIADIRKFIIISRPEYATQTFVLMTTFPSRELTDSTQNIKDANLINAAIVQRIK